MYVLKGFFSKFYLHVKFKPLNVSHKIKRIHSALHSYNYKFSLFLLLYDSWFLFFFYTILNIFRPFTFTCFCLKLQVNLSTIRMQKYIFYSSNTMANKEEQIKLEIIISPALFFVQVLKYEPS